MQSEGFASIRYARDVLEHGWALVEAACDGDEEARRQAVRLAEAVAARCTRDADGYVTLRLASPEDARLLALMSRGLRPGGGRGRSPIG